MSTTPSARACETSRLSGDGREARHFEDQLEPPTSLYTTCASRCPGLPGRLMLSTPRTRSSIWTACRDARLVEECHRVLKPGGLLRIVVPDLKGYVAEYERGQLPATDLLYELHVAGARGLGLKRDIFSLLSGGSHRCMYDGPTLTRLLRDAGFEPRVCKPQESEIPDMDRLEPGPEKWTPEKLARNL